MADVAHLHSIRVGLSDELLHLQDGPAMQGELPFFLRGHNTPTRWLSAHSPNPTAQSTGEQGLDALVNCRLSPIPANVSNAPPSAKPHERETKVEIKKTVEVRILLPSDLRPSLHLYRCDNPMIRQWR